MSKLLRIDPFLPGLVLMILLGWKVPLQGYFPSSITGEIVYFGIAGIFMLYGLKLDLSQLRRDLGHWKLHFLIQGTTFIIFPLLALALYPLFQWAESMDVWLGILYLAALPSTVSYSVMMTSLARGNVTSSIFNASISGIIGIFATPLWMSLFVASSGSTMNISEVISDLTTQILFPVVIGILLQPLLRNAVIRQKNAWAWFDKVVIWIIVYKSFSSGFSGGLTSILSPLETLGLFALVVMLYFIVTSGLWKVGMKLRFEMPDKITLTMNGSMKSLVHGSAMAAILFDESTASVMLIPVMFYHGFVLFYAGYKAKKLGARPV